MRALRWKGLWLAGGALLVAGLLVVSLMPGRSLPGIGVSDKLGHAAAYFVLAFWFAGIAERSRLLAVAIGAFAFGGLCELLQHVTALGRAADVADVIANAIGVSLAALAARAGGGEWMQAVEKRLGA